MKNVPRTIPAVQDTSPGPGAVVEVALYGGELAQRVVWQVVDGLVFVCNAKNYERLLRGQDAAMPIGFPITDVREVA